MDAVSTLLKCLKSKRFINDIEKAKAEVSTERIISTTLIISKKPGNTGISRDIRTEFTTDLLLSD